MERDHLYYYAALFFGWMFPGILLFIGWHLTKGERQRRFRNFFAGFYRDHKITVYVYVVSLIVYAIMRPIILWD